MTWWKGIEAIALEGGVSGAVDLGEGETYMERFEVACWR